MKHLTQACNNILLQLYHVVHQIDSIDYARPSVVLSNSSIGQHLRHTLEFFFCFKQGFDSGVINYDKRAHDKVIELEKQAGLNAINDIMCFIESLKMNSKLLLEVGYNIESDNYITLETNASRELVYNIEHSVHHMALIKIGVREVAPYIKIAGNFGVAVSTTRHQQTSQQIQ